MQALVAPQSESSESNPRAIPITSRKTYLQKAAAGILDAYWCRMDLLENLGPGLTPMTALPMPQLAPRGDSSGAPAMKTGTTTLAIASPEGVVMATEKRATMGHLIGHKQTQKLFSADSHLALTTAGLVGDAQMLARHLSAQAQLYRFRRDSPLPVRGAATMLANILNANKFSPYWVQLIVGGFDDKGGSIYSIDAAGGAIQETWTVTGSGSPFAYGVLEDRVGSDLGVKEATDLVIRALNASMRRDAGSGNGIDIAVIDKDGFRRLNQEDIMKRHKALKLPQSFTTE